MQEAKENTHELDEIGGEELVPLQSTLYLVQQLGKLQKCNFLLTSDHLEIYKLKVGGNISESNNLDNLVCNLSLRALCAR